MSTQSTRFDLELLTETDAWSIEQFSGNWEKLDDAVHFDGALDTNGATPTRGVMVREHSGVSIGAQRGDDNTGILTFYASTEVQVGLEEVVLLGSFVTDWSDKAGVADAMRAAVRMAQARYVPLVLNRRSINIDTEGVPIDCSGAHVRGLPGGTTVTDYDTTLDHETFVFRSYPHNVAGPWGGGDFSLTPTDGSMTDVTVTQAGTRSGSSVRVRNSDLNVRLVRCTVQPTSLGGIRVSADTDTGVGQALTVLDQCTIGSPSVGGQFGVLIDGGDVVEIRNVTFGGTNTYAMTAIKVSSIDRLLVDGVRAAIPGANSAQGVFLWMAAGVRQVLVRRGSVRWWMPFSVTVDGPSDLVLEQLTVWGTAPLETQIASPYVDVTEYVHPLVFVSGTGMRLTMRNVTAAERCMVYFDSIQIAPTYPCVVRTEDCAFGSDIKEQIVVEKYDGTVRDSSVAAMTIHQRHLMALVTNLDTQVTTVVPDYAHEPS